MDKETLNVLASCPLFEGMDASDVDTVMSGCNYKMVHYPAKEIYVLAGMTCRYADIIVSGEMVVTMVGLSGRQVQMHRLKAGTLVAPSFIFAHDSELPVSVETAVRTCVLRMQPATLKKTIDENEKIRMNFIRHISDMDVFLSHKLRVLSLFSVREKVAYFLIKAARLQQSRNVLLDVSRQEIANSFGIQKYSLLRCLSQFKECGAIDIQGREIRIIDAEKLR